MTTATLTPNADLPGSDTNGASLIPAVGSGGTTAWQHTSDGSDTTLAVLNINRSWILGLTTFTIPATATVKAATLFTRARRHAATQGTPTVPAQLRDAAGTQLCAWTNTHTTSGLTNVTSATAALAASQSTIDGLVLFLSRGSSGTATDIAEASVQIVYVIAPTVTVGAPTGTVTTATPTQLWTFDGDDDADNGGVQTRYHLKVFTAAQYGAVGFDPATSTPAYTTGEVVSDVKTRVIGPLANGTVFKTYMRAAQNVNGAPNWSTWVSGATYTTSTDPPGVATLTAVVDTDLSLGAIKLTATRDLAKPMWTHINFERSVDGGTTWQPVRGTQPLAAPTNTIIAHDYEQPEGVPVRYRARGLIISAGVTVSQGAFTTTAAPGVTWSPTGCTEWLRSPADPTGGVLVELLVDAEVATTQHRVGVLSVIGRASPVTVWDTPSLPTGEMRIATRTKDAADNLEALVRESPVLLFQGRFSYGHPYRWMVVTDHIEARPVSKQPALIDYREWTVTYVEVETPPVLS